MYCPFCGYELPDQAKFCQNCGKRLPKYDETYSNRISNLGESDNNTEYSSVLPNSNQSNSKTQNSNNQEDAHIDYTNQIGKAVIIICIIIFVLFVGIFGIYISTESPNNDGSNTNEPSRTDGHVLTTITSNPSGASVYVGGKYKGLTPLTVSLQQNTGYTIVIEKSGYQKWAQAVTVSGSSEKVHVDLISNYNPSYGYNPSYNTGLTHSQYASIISKAIEPANSQVRSYALSAINSQNEGNYNIGQICDIYDKLYKDWVYVNDPSEREYIAPASESVRLLRGDCEDYAILMASLIESIGGTARVIVAYNAAGEGHAYAEVYMTDSNEDVQALVDNMGERYGHLTAHYHSDYEGGHWLNLDWTSAHPGGEFFESVGNELVIRSDGSYVTWN